MGVFVRICLFPLASVSGIDIRKARSCRIVSSSKGEVRNFGISQCERAGITISMQDEVPTCKRRGCWKEKRFVSRLVAEFVAGVCLSKQILPERVSFGVLFGSIDDKGEKRVGS